MAANKTPDIKSLKDLCEQVLSAAGIIILEAEDKITLLEKTRGMFISLETKFNDLIRIRKEYTEDYEERQTALKDINILIYSLINLTDLLDEQDEDYNKILLRLSIAFKLAQKHQHLLSKAQRKLVNIKIKEIQNENLNSTHDWLPYRAPKEMNMPVLDPIALQFYQKLSEENKQKFEDLRRMYFYATFGRHIDLLRKTYINSRNHPKEFPNQELPDHPELLLFSDKKKIESLIASRVAMMVFQQRQLIADCGALDAWRVMVLKQLDDEQTKSFGQKSNKINNSN